MVASKTSRPENHSKIIFAIIIIVIVFAAVAYTFILSQSRETRVGQPIKAVKVSQPCSSDPLNYKPYGWWQQENFDGDPATVEDSSPWNHNGKTSPPGPGGPVFYPSKGIKNKGTYFFDGIDDLEIISDAAGLLGGIETTELKSYECFIKSKQNGKEQFCIHNGKSWGLGTISSGIPQFFMADNSFTGRTTALGTTNVLDGRWHHLVGIKKADTSGNLFLQIWTDGVLEKEVSFPAPVDIPPQGVIYMGTGVYGYLDEKAIYGMAVPSCFIAERAKLRFFCGDDLCTGTEDYNTCPADCPPPTVCGNGVCDCGEDPTTCPQDCISCDPPAPLKLDELLVWYDFEEGSGDTIIDKSNNKYHGKMRPGTNFGPGKEGKFSLLCDSGHVDLKWDRDGDGLSDSTPNLDKIHTDDYSISYWIKPTSIIPSPYRHYLFSVDRRYSPDGGNVGGYSGEIFRNTRGIELALPLHPISEPQTLDARDRNGNILSEGNWYHVVMTHDWDSSVGAATVKFYIDGILHPLIHGGISGSQRPLPNAPRWLCAGNDPTDSTLTNFYNGYVDSMFIYSRVLSESEVAQLYNTLQYC